MIYAASPTLDGLRYVVLDEVHYLQDRYRGAVWEEVIIHLPPEVDLVCLSATVSNAEEFADWIETVRGETDAVIEERRRSRSTTSTWSGSAAPTTCTCSRRSWPTRRRATAAEPRGGAPRRPGPALARVPRDGPARRLRTPAAGRDRRAPRRRADAAGDRLHLQPGRLRPGGRARASPPACASPTPTSGARSAASPRRTPTPSPTTTSTLRYGRWLAGLEAGVAAHHAGIVPPMKEAVEEAFAAGLVKVVFATETLALGINMPARSVVHREAHEVHRRAPRVPHAGGVHAAHRAGRPARDRRGRLRGRALEPVRAVRAGRGARLPPHLRARVVVPAHLQHGGQPRAPLRRARSRTTCSTCRSPSSRPTATSSRSSAGSSRAAEQLDATAGRRRAGRGDVDEYRRLVADRDAEPGTGPQPAARRGAGRLVPGDVLRARRPPRPGRGPGPRNRRAGAVRAARARRVASAGAARARRLRRPARRRRPRRAPEPYAPRSAAFQRRRGRAAAGACGSTARRRRRRRRAAEAKLAPGRRGAPGGAATRNAEEHLRAAAVGRPARARHRPARAAGARPQREPGPPVRPGPAGARVLGLRRRLGAHRRGRDAGAPLHRDRPARGGGAARGLLDGLGRRRPGRAGVVLHVRAAGARRRRPDRRRRAGPAARSRSRWRDARDAWRAS